MDATQATEAEPVVGREAFERAAKAGKPTKDVPIPGLGKVRVQGLNALDFAYHIDSLRGEDGSRLPTHERKSLEKLAVRGVVGPDNKPLFTLVDVDMLSELLVGHLSEIEKAIGEVSGFKPDVTADVEARKKNSATVS